MRIPYGVGPGRSAQDRRAALRKALRAQEPLIVPGITDALGARLVERAGFAAAYATGAGIANAQFGLADIGLVSLGELAGQAGRVIDATGLPVIVDADTGFGSALSVMRTTHLLETAGAAGIQLEDQRMPKRCGHFDGHELVETGEMAAKVTAAARARTAADGMVIVARTDASGVLGLDEAIRRGHAYLQAGADVLFIEAPRTEEELARIGAEFAGVPLVANVVEGGKTPQLPAGELHKLGFTVILFANFLMRVMAKAGQEALAHLRDSGDTRDYSERTLGWADRQTLFALAELDALDGDLAAHAAGRGAADA
jgi:2-methylisocitrate lyase-like PEP mutase family enzyme